VKLRQVSIQLERAAASHAEALLNLAGALAVSIDDARDTPLFEPAPGTTPLWPHLALRALFPADFDSGALVDMLADALPQGTSIDTNCVDESDWRAGLEQAVFVQQVSPDLTIVPADWEGDGTTPTLVRLNMGLAFGTGRHPTTLLCLRWLAENPPRGLTVCDFGCGSGVLAITALKLGATSAVAIDHEPQAIAATRANAALNNVEARLAAGEGSEFGSLEVDLVLANILAGTLAQSVTMIASMLRPRGRIVLSGILIDQADDLIREFAPRFDSLVTAEHDGWARVTGTIK
jgi:ribosomal protein L11 methyltransferase